VDDELDLVGAGRVDRELGLDRVVVRDDAVAARRPGEQRPREGERVSVGVLGRRAAEPRGVPDPDGLVSARVRDGFCVRDRAGVRTVQRRQPGRLRASAARDREGRYESDE
jgi:hypothetical protein